MKDVENIFLIFYLLGEYDIFIKIKDKIRVFIFVTIIFDEGGSIGGIYRIIFGVNNMRLLVLKFFLMEYGKVYFLGNL